jgi:phosphate starvation-inducible protein PhoH and related proteins
MPETVTRSLTLDSRDEAVLLFGNRDQFLKLVRDGLGVRVVARGDTVQIDGSEEAVGQAERAFGQLRSVLRANGQLTGEDVKTVVEVVRAGSERLSPQNLTMTEGGKYLRPLLDSLNDLIEYEQVKKYMENEVIEIVPLAYMRGRTLNSAVIILDEGQNATVSQMKMFLTRMGMNSKIIVTGDITQTDLPPTLKSGLVDAMHRLKGIPRLAVVQLDESDIVRHALVQQIVKAYEEGGHKRR